MQTNPLVRYEHWLVAKICRALPGWVTVDQLTLLGVGGAALTAVSYVAANLSPVFFLVASVGLVVNWFGDSLDGTLARYRKSERPRYGFFVDLACDAISSLLITVGLGFSPYVGMGPALLTQAGYLCMGIYVLLRNHVSGEFHLSFMGCGPTELRLIVIGFNIAMFALGPIPVTILGSVYSLHAMSATLLGTVLLTLFVFNVIRTARALAREEAAALRPLGR